MKTRKLCTICIIMMTVVMIFTSCSLKRNTPAVVTLGDRAITSAEVMIYLLQAKEEFEKLGGPEVWEIPKEDFTGGKTPQEVAKERALDNIIRDKILVKKADSLNVKLEDSVIQETKELAAEYFEKMPENIAEQYHITADIVEESFLDFRLATEVANSITSSYTPNETEISEVMLLDTDYSKLMGHDAEEILTNVVLKRILINTTEMNANNERVPLSEEAQKEALNRINEAYQLAKSGQDFNTLIATYSEEDQVSTNNGEFRISLALLSDELREVVDSIQIGEVSKVVKTEYAYQIIKLMAIEKPSDDEIASYEEEFVTYEKEVRAKAEVTLRQQAFNEIYDEWKKEISITINDELWKAMSLPDKTEE